MKSIQIAAVFLLVACISISSSTAVPKQRNDPNASIRRISNFPGDLLHPNVVGGDDVNTDDPEVEVTNMAHLIIISKAGSSQREQPCTATVLNTRWLLTAAHCLASRDGFSVSFEDTYTFIGETNSTLRIENTNIRPYNFKQYLIHKDYNPRNEPEGSDIAMVEIDRPIASNRYSEVDLARTSADDPKPNDTVIATGYGLTKLESFSKFEFSTTLQKAPLDIRSFEECKEQSPASWRPVLSDQKLICAGSSSEGNNGPTDTCFGDSGGPLFRKRSGNRFGRNRSVQLAITSFASTLACAQADTVAWYTRVSKFNTAITQALNNDFSEWTATSA